MCFRRGMWYCGEAHLRSAFVALDGFLQSGSPNGANNVLHTIHPAQASQRHPALLPQCYGTGRRGICKKKRPTLEGAGRLYL